MISSMYSFSVRESQGSVITNSGQSKKVSVEVVSK